MLILVADIGGTHSHLLLRHGWVSLEWLLFGVVYAFLAGRLAGQWG